MPDLAALRALVDSEASVWKKCPGSVDRDIAFRGGNGVLYVLGLKLPPAAVRGVGRGGFLQGSTSMAGMPEFLAYSEVGKRD